MKLLPTRPDIGHLKRQAKHLISEYRLGSPDAVSRFQNYLPRAANQNLAAIIGMQLRLHDAQSCIAREYGFASWAELSAYVEARRIGDSDPAAFSVQLCRLIYAGGLEGGDNRARPEAAVRFLEDHPELAQTDPWIACAVGDVDRVRLKIETDASWIHKPGGPFNLTPLIAACHSSLLCVDTHTDPIHRVVKLLLDAGADPNHRVTKTGKGIGNGSPHHWQVSALLGAAGVNCDVALTRLLLARGANPNDGETLYHSLDKPNCTPLLLEAGAIVSGSNALFRCLDFDHPETFKLLLAHADKAQEVKSGRLILWAIRRRRSPEFIAALIEAGADPMIKTRDGQSAYTQAMRYGLHEVAEILAQAGARADLEVEDLFLAACAGNDVDTALQIRYERPDLPASLDEARLRLLPELTAAGCFGAAGLMANLGWPVSTRGGDWNASALNHSVFLGNAKLTRQLLESGASWTEEHGYGDNVCGTLSWASMNRPADDGDWLECAVALVDHGMPVAQPDLEDPECVLIDGKRRMFSEEITTFLLGQASARAK